jgi:hypothetical protein
MSGPLTNEKHELFAQHLAKGELQKVAYAKAGYRGDEAAASKLADKPTVRARVVELLGRAAAKAEVTIADIARQLDEDRALAFEVKQPGAAVSASMGKAKLFGHLRDKVEHSGPDGAPIDISVKVSWVDPPAAE